MVAALAIRQQVSRGVVEEHRGQCTLQTSESGRARAESFGRFNDTLVMELISDEDPGPNFKS
jgi:hypothetical protein